VVEEEEVMEIFSPRCSEVEVVEDKEVHKKVNRFNIPLRSLLKKYSKEKHPKLL